MSQSGFWNQLEVYWQSKNRDRKIIHIQPWNVIEEWIQL